MQSPGHRCHPVVFVACSVAILWLSACSGGSGPDADDADSAGADGRLTVDFGEGDIASYLQSLPSDDQPGDPTVASGDPGDIPVVFLHGGAYDASTWSELGLLDDVAAAGHRAVAIDLPGKGESSGERDADWLAGALDALDMDEIVLVSPSASGPVALELLSQDPGRFAGLVPVAPVGGAEFDWKGGEAPETVVVLGESDGGFADATRELADEIPGAELVVIPDAGHAAYEDQPELFLKAILPLL